MADHTSTQAHGNVDVGAETAMDQLARSSPPAPEKTRREKSGTVWTATAHIVALLIGSSVLAVAWTFAQLGWVAGPAVVVSLSVVTYYSSALLADCYRDDDPDHLGGAVHGEYIGAVRSYLGPKSVTFCGIIQYGVLWAAMVAYTITSSSSMSAVQRVNRFHRSWLDASDGDGGTTGVRYMVVFGAFQLLLSQLPSLENVAWLSVIAVATSFGYSSNCLGLCAAKWASHHGGVRGTLAGAGADSPGEKVFNVLLAVGNIAISYIYSPVLFEIQDTVRTPPSESKTMKKASLYGLAVSAVFYLLLGVSGYAAFGNAQQHPHRRRLPRALLARRRRQRLRRRPFLGSLPGHRAAGVREAGGVRRRAVAGVQARHGQLRAPPPRAGVDIRDDGRNLVTGENGAAVGGDRGDDGGGDDDAVLQRRAGLHRRARVLAARRLPPGEQAHREGQDPEGRGAVVGAAGREHGAARRRRRHGRRVRARHGAEVERSCSLPGYGLINLPKCFRNGMRSSFRNFLRYHYYNLIM